MLAVSSTVVASTIDWQAICFDGTITTITTSPPRRISVTTGTCREVSGASGEVLGHMEGRFWRCGGRPIYLPSTLALSGFLSPTA